MEIVNHKSGNKYEQKQHMTIDLVTHKPAWQTSEPLEDPEIYASPEIWPGVLKIKAKHNRNGVVMIILSGRHHHLKCKRNASIIRITMKSL